MSVMRKLLSVFLLAVCLAGALSADSFTMSTEINNVSYGVSNFGWGLFPIGTDFEYVTQFQLFDSLQHKAEFSLDMTFGVGTVEPSGADGDRWYDYQTGLPWWYSPSSSSKLDIEYFRVYSQVETYLEQGFGTNPVAGSGPMVYLNLRWITRYAYAGESLGLSSDGPGGAVFDKPPFSTGESIPAYPWLEGDGNLWNNSLMLSSYWYFRRSTSGTSTYEGLYMDLSFEIGPWWLGNNIFPDTVTSDFYRAYFSATQYMDVFSIRQENGWNWLNLMLGHSNTVSYTWGDVIPEHRIQRDRLRGQVSDSLYLRFTGPQFIASDCYPYFQVSLNNNIYFGGVQNDITGSISGVELVSSVSFEIHLRLFGFIHVNYRFGYDFIKGFEPEGPSWWQNAQLGFYVSL